MLQRSAKLILVAVITLISFSFLTPSVGATGFSGSDINQYTCATGSIPNPSGISCSENNGEGVFNCNGRFVCFYPTASGVGYDTRDALPRPPSLRILEVWFVRILFAVWALSGIVFTGVLISLGVQYMFSFGNPQAVERVIKKFQNFLIGFVLVFLSYPILNTFFSVLPLSSTSDCFANINMPGFQFFFPNACSLPEFQECINQCKFITDCERQCVITQCESNCDTVGGGPGAVASCRAACQ